jgi:hypothetical protein
VGGVEEERADPFSESRPPRFAGPEEGEAPGGELFFQSVDERGFPRPFSPFKGEEEAGELPPFTRLH